MSKTNDSVWKSASVVANYLDRKGSRPFQREQIDVLLKVIRGLGRPVHYFMDLGCGDGILAAAILEEYPDSNGILVDHSPPMLKAAEMGLEGFTGRIHFCEVDYGQTGWVQSVQQYFPLELVVSGFSIHHQPDTRKRSIYAEIFETLRPGGMFINMEVVASRTARISELWDQIRVDSLYEFAVRHKLNKTRAVVEEECLESPEREANRLSLVETQLDWLREIGYVDVDCFFKFFQLAVFGGCRSSV
ncbi:MAG: class I SAM-dependent methyltransferase [Desulfomonilaceae bacterium]